MFESLSERLGGVFDRLTKSGALSEADVIAALREVRVALLEADVSLGVARDFIKRVIGLPGDRIQVIDGILNINGVPVKRRKIEDHIYESGPGQFSRINRYIETLPNGRDHLIVEQSDTNNGSDNTSIYTVPEDHYFMMGDNRDNSNDSRFSSVGYVPRENLVGRAEFVFFSIDGSAWQLWTWLDKLRPSRFFSSIE